MIESNYINNDTLQVQIVDPAPPPPDTLLSYVDILWQNEKSENNQLFDGTFFRISSFEDNIIRGYFSDYKFFFAQIREPSLNSDLKIRSLAVSGLTHNKDGVFLGQRSQGSTQERNLWELPPAGCLDKKLCEGQKTVSLEKQILCELEEELGYTHEDLSQPPQAFVLLENHFDHIIDIGFNLELKPSVLIPQKNDEYQKIKCIDFTDLPGFIRQYEKQMVPCSLALLKAAEEIDLFF